MLVFLLPFLLLATVAVQLYRRPCWMVLTEISQQLSDRLPWNWVKPFMFPPWWIVLTLLPPATLMTFPSTAAVLCVQCRLALFFKHAHVYTEMVNIGERAPSSFQNPICVTHSFWILLVILTAKSLCLILHCLASQHILTGMWTELLIVLIYSFWHLWTHTCTWKLAHWMNKLQLIKIKCQRQQLNLMFFLCREDQMWVGRLECYCTCTINTSCHYYS